MNRVQQLRAQNARQRIDLARVEAERRQLKADLDRAQHRHPDILTFLNEWDWLTMFTDPVHANQLDFNSPSAETPIPGQATAWARSQQELVLKGLRPLIRQMQKALRVPAEERTVPPDKCPCCNRTYRKPRKQP